MATRTSGQHNEMADLDLLTHGPELGGQVAGSFVGFVGREVLIEGVGDAVDLDFVGSDHVVDDGDLEHFCTFVGGDGAGLWSSGVGFGIPKLELRADICGLGWGFGVWVLGCGLAKNRCNTCNTCNTVQRCNVGCRKATNATQQLSRRVVLLLQLHVCCALSCKKKRVRDLRRWPTFDPQISTRWRVRRVQ